MGDRVEHPLRGAVHPRLETVVMTEVARLESSFEATRPQALPDGVLGGESDHEAAIDAVILALCRRAGRKPVTQRTFYRWLDNPQSTPAYVVSAVCGLFEPPLTPGYLRGESCSTADVLALCSRVPAERMPSVLNDGHAALVAAMSDGRGLVGEVAVELLRLEAYQDPEALQSRIQAEFHR